MQTKRYDCGYSPRNPQRSSAEYQTSHDREPADPQPQVCQSSERRNRLLAPPGVDSASLPEELVEDGEPLPVTEAADVYLRIQRYNWTKGGRTSKYERHKNKTYPRILNADRCFREDFDGLTTVMFSRRLSPLDDAGGWLTPWECDKMLHGGDVQGSVRRALNYHLDSFKCEWVAVTAPTESAGTPHEHIYLWIDDPRDEVTTDHLEPALDKHLKHCKNAYAKHHCYQSDGSDGAITVRHTPPLVNQTHDKVAKEVVRGNTPPQPNTAGAQYLASQLAHLPVGDYYSEDVDTPPDPLFEGGALAWASNYNWLRSTQGVPTLNNERCC